jgi:hypothetical protein
MPSQTNNFATASGWTNSANALTAGAGVASTVGGQTGALTLPMISDGLALPANATITGIQIDLLWKSDGNTYFSLNSVRLRKNGVTIGNNLATNQPQVSLPPLFADIYVSVGGDGQLWGAAFTSSDTLGVEIVLKDVAYDWPAGTCFFDHVRATVFYASAAPAGAAANLALLLP